MSFSDEENKCALLDQNRAINEVNEKESGGILNRFRGPVSLKARIFLIRESDK